ncbi:MULTISPECIES: hypothetical protein [Rhizobium/Agrobacterium group]|uniref:Uncharacterized protein n=1 Tax=Agrobacterium salinitolerans TaxID=1183413 RepID=A0A9X3R0P7_9HYPH|nr:MULTISPECIES: hypothetical protein [Rhizobium/Agrobacterium group]MCZ7466734.1 hypothetical protein [Rhizobium rhizogenes]MCZ7939233.1 hypothetical protein [Agrobacterium salinitolerans]
MTPILGLIEKAGDARAGRMSDFDTIEADAQSMSPFYAIEDTLPAYSPNDHTSSCPQ